ncbi:SEFIR domain-containing protein [Methanobrevibacter sp.]|uniref:SEFIR domain-containing protein n=1 Tax=Methanobrevibacter sp. TaxID=66852 RepID=UPI003D7D7A8E
MDKASEKVPKVFISYSWTNEEHIEQVIEFATYLVNNHVDVILDEWDAPEGIDLNYFMEENVRSEDTDFVLIISDKEYARKANERTGGVGTETQIISKRVYEDVNQTKFIPIVWQNDDDGKPCLPDYLASRRYFDLTPKNRYSNSEKVLRRLHGIPENPKPKLGEFPKKLLETNKYYPSLKEIIETFDEKIEKNPKSINSISRHFFKDFLHNFDEFKIKFQTRNALEIANQLHDNIEEFIPLRNYYIEFIEKITQVYEFAPVDGDIIKELFENIYSNYFIPKPGESYISEDFMNFDFIVRELFLYTITISIKNEYYQLTSNLLNTPYFFNDPYNSNDTKTFLDLDKRRYVRTDEYLTYYCKEHNLNKLTGMGHFLISRIHKNYVIEELVNSDILCCHISIINLQDSDGWFPFTYIYKETKYMHLYQKLISESYYKKVKCIFDIESKEELVKKIKYSDEYFGKMRYGFRSVFMNYVKPISEYINADEIASRK